MIVMVTMMIVMVIIFMQPRPPLPSLCNESQALPDHYRWHLRWKTKYAKRGDDDDDDDDFVDDDHNTLIRMVVMVTHWLTLVEPKTIYILILICKTKGHWTGMNQVMQDFFPFHR